MNEKVMFENAHKLLETHFKIKVCNKETLNAWQLFKEDYVKQIEENQAYKDKEDKLKSYLSMFDSDSEFKIDILQILNEVGDGND